MATSSTKSNLHIAGTALLSIGVGLISYGLTLHGMVKYALIGIGIVINGVAMIAFVHIPATDTSKLADAIRKIQLDESKAEPFLAKYKGNIEAAIEDIVKGEIAKAIKVAVVPQNTTTTVTPTVNSTSITSSAEPSKNVEAK